MDRGFRAPGVLPRAAVALLFALVLLTPSVGASTLCAQTPVLARTTTRIGVLEGDDRYTLGTIKDASIDRQGRVAVLDQQAQVVKVFSRTGQYLASVGKPGRGPGEFFVPMAVTHDRRGNLYVLDPANQRVEVFEPSGSGYRRRGAFGIDFPAYDLCAAGDELFLYGFREGSILHAFDSAGVRVRSFGAALFPDHEYLRVASSRGHVECMEEARVVVVLPNLFPTLRAFRASGAPLWSVRLPGYEQVRIQQSERGMTYSGGPSGRHHVASSLTAFDDRNALLQIGLIGHDGLPKKAEELGAVTSYLVSVRDGRLRSMPDHTPRILSMRHRLAAAVRASPFPAVTLYRLLAAREYRLLPKGEESR